MSRVIIIRDDGDNKPIDRSYEADVCRANDKINRCLGTGFFGKKKSRRD